MKKLIGTCLILLLLAATNNSSIAETVELRVSANFKKELVSRSSSLQAGDSVIDILRRLASVETSQGGAFVSRINLLPKELSGDEYWFYYVNGVLANTGALTFKPQVGDKIHWDLHNWKASFNIPSIIGAYPAPFTRLPTGKVLPTRIHSSSAYATKVESLVKSLEKAGARSLKKLSLEPHSVDDEESIRVLIGTWEDLKQTKIMQAAVNNPEKFGLFLKAANGVLKLSSFEEKQEKEFKVSTGFIVSLCPVYSTNVFWLVGGNDSDGVESALELLSSQPERFRGYAGVVISEGELFHAPLLD